MEMSKIGCVKIPNLLFEDDRGYFTELFKSDTLAFLPTMKQINLSESKPNVLRGFHAQRGESAQSKLIRVLTGAVTSCIVDLRRGSPTYGEVEIFELRPGGFSLFVPVGYGNSFWTHEKSLYHYCCSEKYDKGSEVGITPIDSSMPFPWNETDPIVAHRDRMLPFFANFDSPFEYNELGQDKLLVYCNLSNIKGQYSI